MNGLRAMQRELADALRMDEPSPLASLCGDGVADVATRFAIYHHGYRIRLREALGVEFPGLARLHGRRIDAMVDSYVRTHPSSHFNIRWHGGELADFLAATAPWRDQPELADMARLDWAISTAFDAADHTTVDATALARVPPEAWASLRLHLLPHVRLLRVMHNVDAFRRAADRHSARPPLRRLRQPRCLLIWRPALEVRYRSVGRDELPILQAALEGKAFANLCELAAERHGTHAALPRVAALLAQWLGEGLVGTLGTSPIPDE